MTARPASGLRLMAPGTMSRRLVLSVTALVAVIAVVLLGLTALSMQRILEGQLDQQLLSTTARMGESGRGGRGLGPGDGGPGQAQGLLVCYQDQGCYVQVDRSRQTVTEEAMQILTGLEPDPRPMTRHLPGLGDYRLLTTARDGRVLVVGQSVEGLTASMSSILIAVGLFTLLAIVVAFLAARAVVERNLRPLARLAGTAHQVSSMDLSRGDVAVPVRVAAPDANPASEVGQVGLAFNHMLDNVEGALAARQASETKVRQFVADASHELRNPLASIRGYAELTRRERDEVPQTTAHALARIEAESVRMSRLVEDLLLLARLDAGPALSLAAVPLGALLANAASDAEAAGPDHLWSLSLPETEVVALADEHRIHQVVVNLLANARTHTPAGTRVEAALTQDDSWAVISVTDDGPGIPAEMVDRVFERFTRADVSRVRSSAGPSTGLGLAIVAAVVAAHGGQVAVESRPGHTRFTVRLPRAA